MAETSDLLIRLRSDASGVEDGNRKAQRSFDDLRGSVERGFNEIKNATAGAALGVGSVGAALAGVAAIAGRGEAFQNVERAFENISKGAGVLASEQLPKLREALGGTVADLDLMREANKAVLLGLDATQLDEMAESARKLGAAVGRTATESFQDLVTGVGRGSALILDNLGVIVDTQKAYDDFAKKIGTTADALNDAGKKAAFQEAAFVAIKQKADQLAPPLDTVAQAFARLASNAQNVFDNFSKMLNQSGALTSWVNNFARGVDILAERLLGLGSAQAKLVELQGRIQSSQALIRGGELGAFPTTPAVLERERQNLANLQKEYDGLILQYRKTTEASGAVARASDTLTDKYIDQGKAAKQATEEATKAWEKWKADTEAIAGFSSRIIDNALNLQFGDSPTGTSSNLRIEPLDKAFENSVNLFSDLLTPMFEGQAANFEDIFTDAAKRVAIGFASQMLASMATSFGLGNIGGIGGAGGLGASLAATLGFAGGGTQPLGDFIGPVLPGAAGAAGGAAVGGGSLGATFSSLMPYAAAAAAAYFAGSGIKNIADGGKLSIAEQAALSVPTFGASFLYNPISDFFGGDSQKRKELEARKGLLEQIFGGSASFQGIGGIINLNADTFTSGGAFGGQANALVNPLAEVLGGGGKLGDDLSAIFEAGVSNAGNFNEVIVNTLSLMDRLGLNAEDTKDQLAQLFLDGKVTLDEFSVGIDNLNILAQEDLVGPNSVADAINIVTTNLDNPRVALKGLELAFKEMSQLGIDTSTEVAAYLTDKFGPDIAEAFQDIMDAGIDTWQEVGEAGPEQLRIIFKELSPLQQVFEDTAESAKKLGEQNMDRLNNGLKSVRENAEKARQALERMNKEAEAGASGGENPNQPNNPNGA